MSTTILISSGAGEVINELLIPLVVALVVGFATYYFGFRQYLKQRMYELIRKTYIEGSIESVMNGTDQISMACYQNYSRAIFIFKTLNESTETLEKNKQIIENIFTEMDGVRLAPNYAVLKLTIFDQFLSILVTKMWVELQQLNETIRHTIKQSIRDYFDRGGDKTEEERKDFLLENKNLIQEEWNKIIRKYEPLKGHLLRLQVETDKLHLTKIEDLDKIAVNKKIIKIMNEIKAEYDN